MVDTHLPIEDRERPLRSLFLDFNAYFASVEQQEESSYRGRPIAVVPVLADTTFVIAASYEAKALGIKTGTMVREAKQKCPDIIIVKARPSLYVAYHKRVQEVADSVLPIEEVCSIDEMRFGLLGKERQPEEALKLANRMKEVIARDVGPMMRCSIGIAPNGFLAKIATEMQKPDGLVMLQAHELPTRLFTLKLTDFTGINKRMQARLHAAGIFSAEQMCTASKQELRHAFGSVVGERWWYLLRGYDLQLKKNEQKSLGHSHVLAPQLRTDQGCHEVLLRLLSKASARLRANNLCATAMTVAVKGYEASWKETISLPPTQDSVVMIKAFQDVWTRRNFRKPRLVSITFDEIAPPSAVTPSLFDETEDRTEFNRAIDAMNQKFGKNKVHLAGMHHVQTSAEEKIAFNKTWLFSEGKDDNVWPDTFRGLTHRDD